MSVIHWAGGVRVLNGRRVIQALKGWPCCCSGHKAEVVRKKGNQTYASHEVTCKNCLKLMEMGGIIYTREV